MNLNQVREWCVSADDMIAPEVRGNPSIMGKAIVAGLTNGEEKGIFTSAIAKVNGRTITTKSGSIYTLVGPPNKHFMEHLAERGMEYNDAAPLDVLVENDYIRIGGLAAGFKAMLLTDMEEAYSRMSEEQKIAKCYTNDAGETFSPKEVLEAFKSGEVNKLGIFNNYLINFLSSCPGCEECKKD